MLFLKAHLIPLVRSGQKTQTIRLWPRPMVRANQVAYAPGLGRLRIVSVDPLTSLRQLTRADAIADGFASLKALRAELHSIYGQDAHSPSLKKLYRVRFVYPANAAGGERRAVKKSSRRSNHKTSPVKQPPSVSKADLRKTLAAYLRARTV